MRRCTVNFLVGGLAIVTLGIAFGMFAFPYLLQSKIKKQIRLEKDGDLYNRWVDIKIPIYMKVYFFNITNPEEFAQGSKPILDQVGPYIYQQRRQKVVTSIHPENDTIQFRPKITYFFRSNMSEGRKEGDIINFVNVPLLSVVTKALSMGPVTRSLILEIVNNHKEELFTRRTVGELLFRGYDEPMIKELSELQGGEPLMPDNRFGIYYGKNGTAQDLFEIYSGVIENEKFGMTISWKGKKELDFWGSDFCNMINGSDGSIFPPFISRERVIRIFSPDMCRSIYMLYSGDVELKGIPAYRFTTPKEVMADPRNHSENVCYCPEAEDDDLDKCAKAGVFRIAACRKGAPIVASWPHFFDGDVEYQNQSIGLKPEKELHETFLSLEPNTGALLQASKRFQINIEIKPTKYLQGLKKIPKMILPLIWVDESVSLTDDNANMIRAKLLTPMKIGTFGMFGLLGVGALLIMIAFILIIVPGYKGDKH